MLNVPEEDARSLVQSGKAEFVNERTDAQVDNLTHIRGIGYATAETLNEAGIVTFGDLAGADATALAKLDGISLRQAAAWIVAAQDLAAEES